MTSSNLGSVVLILFIFSLIHLFLSLSIGIADIKNNWSKYKCNPGIIPFANIFGHSPVETAKECIRTTQMNFMSDFLEPIYGAIGFLSEHGNFFNQIFKDMNLFGNIVQDSNLDFANNIENWFDQISSELNITFNSFIKIFNDVHYVFINLAYIFQSTGTILTSSMQELPFLIVRMASSG